MAKAVCRSIRRIATVVFILPAMGACTTLVSPRLANIDDTRLLELIHRMLQKHDQPAMAAAVFDGRQTVAKAVAGTGLYGEDLSLDLARSRFHIGSTTKPMTATLIAMLIEEGALSWETTLSEIYPHVEMRSEYRTVTVHQLLISTGGIIPMQEEGAEPWGKSLFYDLPSEVPDPRRQRQELLARVLSLEPVAKPGTMHIYSNAGWAILGAIAEKVTGTPYEKLLKERVFNRLGMSNARIGGWPASPVEPLQPRGHYGRIKNPYTGTYHFAEYVEPHPQELGDEYVLPPWMNPAGGVHCTATDYLLFAADQALGLQGKGKLMSTEAYQKLHTRYAVGTAEGGTMHVGYGFGVTPRFSAVDGSAGTFYARLVVIPKSGAALVFFSNCGNGEEAITDLMKKLIRGM